MIKWKIEDAYKVLRKDPVMKKIIQKTGKFEHGKARDVYYSLLQSITSQQLSTKAADTIFTRFIGLFKDGDPTENRLIRMDIEKLRQAGLSYSKGQYLKNIALFSKSHGLDYNVLNKMTDEETIDYLCQIKGVGKWTAEMILMFTMNRPDIFPYDDLGIKKSIMTNYNIKGEGKKLITKMEQTAEQWRPYRTLACRHLWRSRDES